MLSPIARKRRNARYVRYAVIIFVLLLSTVIGLLHQLKNPAFFPVGVDALCPFGGIETFWSLLSGGVLIRRIALSSVLLLVTTVVVALIAGRSFCGQICPLGTLQELFGRLGRKLKITRPGLPGSADTIARLLKYVVLAVITIATWTTASLVIRPYDPWAAYHHLTSPELFTEFAIGAVILGLSLAGSLVYERFFCRYACPMGAFLGLMSRFSWFKIRRTADTCTDCGRCDKACPVGLDVSSADAVTSPECIMCGECVSDCPVPETLEIKGLTGKTMSPLSLTLITAAVFFGIIGVSTAAGSFEWTKTTFGGGGGGQGHGNDGGGGQGHESEAVTDETQTEVIDSESTQPETGTEAQTDTDSEHVPGAGRDSDTSLVDGSDIDVTAIRGYMTPNDVIDATDMEASALSAAFDLSDSDLGIALKDLKEAKGFTMYDFRVFVATELGAPVPEAEEGH